VYNDIRRLLALSFPGHSGEVCEVIGRDAFLTALGDQALRVRVPDQQPATQDDALAIVCRMEAYGSTATSGDDTSEDLSRRRVRVVNTAASEEQASSSRPDSRHLRQLESKLAEWRREIRQLRADSEFWKARAEAATAAAAPPAPPTPTPSWWPPPSGPGPTSAWNDYNSGPSGFGPAVLWNPLSVGCRPSMNLRSF